MRQDAATISIPEKKVTSASDVVVRIQHLEKSFGDTHVLRDVNLELHASENLVILGRSGTGKSVLIKCMVGLIKPDSGSIHIMTYDVSKLNDKQMNELRLQVGFSFQGSALYDSMTVRENIQMALLSHHDALMSLWKPANAMYRDEAMALLDRVGMADADPKAHIL